MERVERLQSGPQICALDGALHGAGPFGSRILRTSTPPSGKKVWFTSEARERDDGRLFASHRARLLGIAHRMLGSRGDAEDVVQDVDLRWHQSARGDIESPIAFLVTITHLGFALIAFASSNVSVRHTRVLAYSNTSPEITVFFPKRSSSFSEEVSMAFLAVIERLGPEERTAFLLHDVLDYDYHEMGRMLSKTESACRQMIHRARIRIRDPRAHSQSPGNLVSALSRSFSRRYGRAIAKPQWHCLQRMWSAWPCGSTLTFCSTDTMGASNERPHDDTRALFGWPYLPSSACDSGRSVRSLPHRRHRERAIHNRVGVACANSCAFDRAVDAVPYRPSKHLLAAARADAQSLAAILESGDVLLSEGST